MHIYYMHTRYSVCKDCIKCTVMNGIYICQPYMYRVYVISTVIIVTVRGSIESSQLSACMQS